MKSNRAARILTIMLILTLGSAFGAACKKKSNVPTKEEYLKTSLSDPDHHGMKDFAFSKSELLSAWGEPDFDKDNPNVSVWTCGDKYLIACFDPDDSEKIVQLYASFTQDMVILFTNANVVYVVKRDKDMTDTDYCFTLSTSWFAPGTMEFVTEELGTILQMEFDGYFMETFPAQIGQPYSIKVTGRVPDEELPALKERAQYIRENYTGEK